MADKMKAALLLSCLCLLAGCGITGRSGQLDVRPVGDAAMRAAPVDAQFEQAKRHIAFGNNALAIEILRRVKRDRPDDVRVLNALGVAYDKIGRFDVSRRYYDNALGIDPTAAYVAHNLGYSLSMQGRDAEARVMFARAASGNDADVRTRTAALDASAPLRTTFRTYLPAITPPSLISRTSALVQTFARPLPAAVPAQIEISLDASAALLAVTDDRAVAGTMVRSGSRLEEWETLVAAALSAPAHSGPAATTAHSHVAALDPVIAARYLSPYRTRLLGIL